ncbi:BAG domain [Mycobacteroides abscessus subsp. abscessus]|nr:BAG domain [Mycobacteroides abscessus subsp. abscessus]
MLLKELVKLDGIDVTGNDILRENRKKVIKFIQDHQKRLDKFKRDISV